MTLTIANFQRGFLPVEWNGLTPDSARHKRLADIERWKVPQGNQLVAVGELFKVSGKPDDCRWDLEGDFSRVHGVGAGMTFGQIRLHGSAGRHIGSHMRGGEICIDGDAGDFLRAEMHSGMIRVSGSAGNFVGTSYRGSPRGMTGGTILVDGDCGDETGHSCDED